MNIKEAKTEIIHTLRAYLKKDEQGHYTYPLVRQRPILLMGPPGIGKTAVMEQISRECGVGLVAYTITHHTRQSAVGLPKIVSKMYDGIQMDVTEYTMSEIIASVYECMEKTGKKEGILFIDEINCVSETLAPTMLQFLQNKTFGSHKVPEGWVIVAAGNPPEYNKSVREFDIVTLDRVRRIDIEADADAWMEYAWENHVHGAILSYLDIKKDNFYIIENTVDGKFFVTARGWEDLSEILKSYEEMGIEISEKLVIQFLQKEETARDFAAYYKLYRGYGIDYGIPKILDGSLDDEAYETRLCMARNASFEERFTVTGLFLEALDGRIWEYEKLDRRVQSLYETLKHFREYLKSQPDMQCFGQFIEDRKKSLAVQKEAELLTVARAREEEWELRTLEQFELTVRKRHITEKEKGFSCVKDMFGQLLSQRKELMESTSRSLDNGFAFIEKAFGDGQEMLLFITKMTGNGRMTRFISSHGCAPYFRYSEKLLYKEQEQKLQAACQEALQEL